MKISFESFKILKWLSEKGGQGFLKYDACARSAGQLKRWGFIHKICPGEYKLTVKGQEFINRSDKEVLKDVKPRSLKT